MVKRHSGWVLIDITCGILLIGILAGILAVAASSHASAQAHLSGSRAALRLAEQSLLELQTGKMPSRAAGEEIHITALPGSASTPGFAWARVDASASGRTGSIIGLVPQSSLSRESGGSR